MKNSSVPRIFDTNLQVTEIFQNLKVRMFAKQPPRMQMQIALGINKGICLREDITNWLKNMA